MKKYYASWLVIYTSSLKMPCCKTLVREFPWSFHPRLGKFPPSWYSKLGKIPSKVTHFSGTYVSPAQSGCTPRENNLIEDFWELSELYWVQTSGICYLEIWKWKIKLILSCIKYKPRGAYRTSNQKPCRDALMWSFFDQMLLLKIWQNHI